MTASRHTPTFSIVIPTLNEEQFLPRLLNDLKNQTYKHFEVIHVDGYSEDQTCAKAAEFKPALQLKTIKVKKRNVSFQRNTGSDRASGQWVIFMDADNQVKKSFLAQLVRRLEEHPDTDIFSCLLDKPDTSMFMKSMVDFCNIVMLMTARVRPFAAGALIGIRKEKLHSTQFNTDMRMSEDHQFVEQAVKSGCRYRVFRNPKYMFSLRRFEKEGSLKIMVAYAQSAAVLLGGQKFERFLPEYPMVGGALYSAEERLHGFLPSMRDIIRRTTTRQQLKLQKYILSIQQLINEL